MQLEAPPVTKFKKPSWRTIANLYREGLTHVFGGDPENPDECSRAMVSALGA